MGVHAPPQHIRVTPTVSSSRGNVARLRVSFSRLSAFSFCLLPLLLVFFPSGEGPKFVVGPSLMKILRVPRKNKGKFLRGLSSPEGVYTNPPTLSKRQRYRWATRAVVQSGPCKYGGNSRPSRGLPCHSGKAKVQVCDRSKFDENFTCSGNLPKSGALFALS